MVEMKMLTAEQKARHLASMKTRRPKYFVENAILNAVPQIITSYGGKVTVRQVYYKLVSMNASDGKPILQNTTNQYTQMDATITKLRENGKLSFYAFEDRSRTEFGNRDTGFSNPDKFLSSMEDSFKMSSWQYDLRMWDEQPNRVFILLEKDTLSRVFEDAISYYRIRGYTTHGYESCTKMKQLADECKGDKNNIVLHFSDYDPSGVDMTRDARVRLIRYGAQNLTVKRRALTPRQIKRYTLPYSPWKIKDPRAKKYPIKATELDALDPRELTKIIKHTVKLEIDKSLWMAKKQQIEDEKAEIEEKLKKVKITYEDKDVEEGNDDKDVEEETDEDGV